MTTLTKTIEGFPNYTISTEGVVTNIKTGRTLKAGVISSGYLNVGLFLNGKMYNKLIHRLVAEAFIPNVDLLRCIDHIDRNKLNNDLSNLRWASHATNSQNKSIARGSSSQYIGVSWQKKANKWEAHIVINSKKKYLGYYTSEEQAAIAYDYASYEHNFLHHNNLVYSLIAV
jgi:HNH endonuclease/AP2 domain